MADRNAPHIAPSDGFPTTLWNALVGVRIGLEEAVENHDMGAVADVLTDVCSLLDVIGEAAEAAAEGADDDT